MRMRKVGFEALIKQIKIKSLVSGDKSAEIILWLQDKNVSNEILNSLNELQRADKNVGVAIAEIK